ncbi:uncharacterized protein [Rutidosis leptorrhynchoides]|uniref:uncharacterized protein n=1 Tax=Rutidosis leptorrhynchoides TaxID=125765 RepID=UPI003A99C45B
MGIEFKNSFTKQIGNESDTSFLNKVWVGNSFLKDAYTRLFRLETQKEASVSMQLQTSGVFNWAWARQPMGSGLGELDALKMQLAEVQISEEKDKWEWALDGGKAFTVKRLAGICDDSILAPESNLISTLRNNLVPKKIEIFMWRLMNKRLSIRFELDKRGIDLHSVRCALCDNDIETTDHTILFCSFARDIWSRVSQWWGLGVFSNLSFIEILKGNFGVSMSTFGKKIWQTVEWISAYYIWRNRNDKTFRGTSWCAPVTLNKIQFKSFEWISLRAKCKTRNL